MSLSAFEQFGVKSRQGAPEGGVPMDWEPIRSEALWRYVAPGGLEAANEHERPFPAPLPPRGPWNNRLIGGALAALDWIVVAVVAEIASRWAHGAGLLSLPAGESAGLVGAALMLKAGLWLTGFYETPAYRVRAETALGGLALGAIAGVLLAGLAAPNARAAAAIAATLPLGALTLGVAHAAFGWLRHAAWRRYAFAERVVLIGATDMAARVLERAARTRAWRVLAIADDRTQRAPMQIGQTPVAAGIEALLDWPGLPAVDRVMICLPPAAQTRIDAILARLSALPQRIDLVFQHGEGALNPITIAGADAAPASALAKRCVDLVLGAALLGLMAPAMALTALALRCESAGPLLRRRSRLGRHRRPLALLAFRTDRDVTHAAPVGAAVRRLGLDRLPYLAHVLTGELSLVGPAPHGARTPRLGEEHAPGAYARRFAVKPGLTGLAQIAPPAKAADPAYRCARDCAYVARRSFWLDLWVLLVSAPAMLRR